MAFLFIIHYLVRMKTHGAGNNPFAKKSSFLLIAGIMFAALNLRIGLTSFPPLLDDISRELSLSNAQGGLLNTLPFMLFGVFALLSRQARNFGIEKSLFIALALITLGTLGRPLGGSFLLFGGTVLISIGIALGNVLLPSMLKRDFPEKITLITTVYVTLMTVASATASGIAVPLAMLGSKIATPASETSALNWRFSLAVWAVLGLLALLIWLPRLKDSHAQTKKRSAATLDASVWKSPLAWEISLFMVFLTIGGGTFFTWLPGIVQSLGTDQQTGGWLLGLYQVMGLLAGLALPLLVPRMKDQSLLACVSGLFCATGALGLYLYPAFPWLWVTLAGFGNGMAFILCLTFISLRTKSETEAADLSGMVHCIGYLGGAAGPFLFGFMFDRLGSWDIPLILLFIAALGQAWFGLRSGLKKLIK